MKNREARIKPSLEVLEKDLNHLLADVNECFNRKVNDSKTLDAFKAAFRKTQPQKLKGGQLKDYQKEALVWMIELSYKKLNGILADDMGLGKTIQTISYLAYLAEEHEIKGKHIIVCPLTVCNNWQREIKKWLPSANAQILWGVEEERILGLNTFVKSRSFDILIAPYHVMISCFNQLRKIPWEVFIIDEAHKIKNDEAILTETIKAYDSNFKLLLTGTPLSNNLRELWSLLNFIMPDLFNDQNLFDDIEDAIREHNGDENEKFAIQCRMAKKFHGIIRPFIMRRTKKQTDLGLPPKTEHTLYVSMTKLQLKMYRNYLKYRSVYGKGKGYQASGQIATRKICNHPYLYPEIEQEGADQYGEHLVQNCGKMIVLDKLLNKLINKEKRKILIFSQFKIQLNILEDYCAMRGYNYERLDGETNVEEREEQMKRFNDDKNYEIPIFMLSTRAGGLGINLVSANVVIIYDIDWNPQNDAQAMDRAYRIGQTKPVNVYKMITEHTIEERMLEFQKYKLIWDELVIQKGTIMNIKNDDVFMGLSYEKVANMKKGQIFKIEAKKDNKTIDEIIKMGQQKDEKKYNEIKKKVLKQIEEQKNAQSFSANPFEDNELKDEEGDAILKKFQGEELVTKKKDLQFDFKNEKRSRLAFFNQLQVPEFHLMTNIDEYKEESWKVAKANKLMGQLDENSEGYEEKMKHFMDEVGAAEAKIQKIKNGCFVHWRKQQFDSFVNQEIKEMDFKVENFRKLHEMIPTKSVSEIKKYKAQFYEIDCKNKFPRISKIRQQIICAQEKNKNSYQQTQFFNFLVEKKAVVAKQKDPIGNMLNNMRIQSGIEEKKDFLASDGFKNDECIKMIKMVDGFAEFKAEEEKIATVKNLQRRFFKKENSYEAALENPERESLMRAEFEARTNRIIDLIKKERQGLKTKSKANSEELMNSKTEEENDFGL